MELQQINADGFQWNNGKFVESLVIPDETGNAAPENSNAIRLNAGVLEKWNGTAWSQITGTGGTGGGDFVAKTVTALRADTDSSGSLRYYITDLKKEGFFEPDLTDTVSDDDSAMCLVNAADIRVKRIFDRIIYPEWWGALGDGTTDDSPAFNAMFRWMEEYQPRGSFEVNFRSNNYYAHSSIVLPYTIQTLSNDGYPFVKISGHGVTISTDQAIRIFDRMPATDSDVGTMNTNYKLILEGIYFKGDRSTSNQIGLRLACQYGGALRDCHFYGLDTALVGHFLTKFTVDNCFFTVQKTTDIILQSLQGFVGTQTIPGSATNDTLITNCRFFKEAGSHAAVVNLGADNTRIEHCVIEGNSSTYAIESDYQGSTNVNVLYINDIWFEQSADVNEILFKIRGSGHTRISRIQREVPHKLFDFSDSNSTHTVIFDGMDYPSNMAAVPFTSGPSSGRTFHFKNVITEMATLLFDATKWSEGVLPPNLYVEFWEGANAGYTFKSNNTINIYSRFGVGTPVNRDFNIDSNLIFKTDNAGSIGGTYTVGYGRPQAVHVGSEGIWLDNAAHIRFGIAGSGPSDLGLSRRQANILRVDSTGDLILPVGTTAQRGPDDPGAIRFNSETGKFEGFTTIWGDLGGGGIIPFGNTAGRPVSPSLGTAYINTEITVLEYWNGTAWAIAAPLTYDSLTNKPVTKFGTDSYQFGVTGALKLPIGTTAQRPSTGLTGMRRWNTDTPGFEYYNGATWVSEGSGGGGGTSSWLYITTVSADVAQNFDAMTFLKRIVIRSDIAITGFKIGTTTGGSEIWTGNLSADDVNHTQDRVFNVNMWFPLSSWIYFTGINSTGAEVVLWYDRDIDIPTPGTP
jgi:hypothetical protein